MCESVNMLQDAVQPQVLAGHRAGRARTLTWLTYLFIFAICFAAWIPFAIEIAGLNLRLSQMLLPVVLLRLWIQRPVRTIRRASVALLGLGGVFWLALLFWTAVNLADLPSAVGALGRVFLLGLNLLHLVTVYLLARRTGRWQGATLSLLASVTVLNSILLGVTVGARLGLSGLQRLLSEEGAPILLEGELISGTVSRFKFAGLNSGVISAAALVIVIALLLQPGRRRLRWLWLVGAVAAIGMVLGFSRQNVVSLAGGLAVVGLYLVLQGRLTRLIKLALLMVVIVVVGLVALFRLPGGQEFYAAFAGRALLLFRPEAYSTGTVSARTAIWSGMWRDIQHNPLTGLGQDAYLRHILNPNESGSHNYPLEVLHSSGLIGFLAYLGMHVLIGYWAWRALFWHWVSEDDRALLLGLIGAYVALWLSSFTNLIFSTPVYWAVIGLVLAGVQRLRERPKPLSRQVPAVGRHSEESLGSS